MTDPNDYRVSLADIAAEYAAAGGDAPTQAAPQLSARWYYRARSDAGASWAGTIDFDEPVDRAAAERVVRTRVGPKRMHGLSLKPARGES